MRNKAYNNNNNTSNILKTAETGSPKYQKF